jgi:hypothetical protein
MKKVCWDPSLKFIHTLLEQRQLFQSLRTRHYIAILKFKDYYTCNFVCVRLLAPLMEPKTAGMETTISTHLAIPIPAAVRDAGKHSIRKHSPHMGGRGWGASNRHPLFPLCLSVYSI